MRIIIKITICIILVMLIIKHILRIIWDFIVDETSIPRKTIVLTNIILCIIYIILVLLTIFIM